MKGIWLPWDALQLQEQSTTIILKYVAELGMASTKIESGSDVFFYIQLKSKVEVTKFLYMC